MKPDIITSKSTIKIITLSLADLDAIFHLISSSYQRDSGDLTITFYSRDYLYWYLRVIPSEFMVGVTFNDKLVGLIVANIIPYIWKCIKGDCHCEFAQISLFCVDERVRGIGLGKLLIREMEKRLAAADITQTLHLATQRYKRLGMESSIGLTVFIIPINCERLYKIGFLEHPQELPYIENNLLHLMSADDIDCVVTKLNASHKSQTLRPKFTNEILSTMLTKKRVVYSFVQKNKQGEVTDFVCVFQRYQLVLENEEEVSEAVLGFYFHETMNITLLLAHLIDKLYGYGFDHLSYLSTGENLDIDLKRLTLPDTSYLHFGRFKLSETLHQKINVFPF